MALSMLDGARNKIAMNAALIELNNKICAIKGNYWNKFSEIDGLENNLIDNHYCYFFFCRFVVSGSFKSLL